MKRQGRRAKLETGFQKPLLTTLIVVVIFIALLFVSRQLNRPERESKPVEIRYSDRYRELVERESLSEAEQAELELESCRFERDMLAFVKTKPFANYDGARAKYLRDCDRILPLNAEPE